MDKLAPEKVLAKTTVQAKATITPSGSIKVRTTSRAEVWGDFTYVKKDEIANVVESKSLHQEPLRDGYMGITIEKNEYSKPSTFSNILRKARNAVSPEEFKEPTVFVGWNNYPKIGILRKFKEHLE